MLASLKRVLIGSPLATEQLANERLTNPKALAVFSSDALSSVAYATEEILLVLILAGSSALTLSLPVAVAIGVLMLMVGLSYRQTIFAYPNGGGSYIVAKDNLGTYPGLVAGSALLIDYVLTVAVSISAGVAAITSAFPEMMPYRVWLCLAAITLITLANLRGVKESGSIFAAPTYVFIGSMYVLILTGFIRLIFTGLPPVSVEETVKAQQSLTLFLVLRAFSSGCAAMTGVEAISNGVQAFHEPVSKNAAKTLVWMVAILMSMFLGITFLAHVTGIHPTENGETVLSQLARAVVGQGWFYYVIQAATALILLLAANTSYADFPRLASLIARDGFLPRQLANRGDRLVFSNGIVFLGFLAAALVVHYGGETHALIPLYAVGVFLSFTLSQAGMVVHWFRERATDRQWRTHALVNGLGATMTGVVLIVIGATKFAGGAWMIILLIPLVVIGFRAIRKHYDIVAQSLRIPLSEKLHPVKHTIIIPVAGVNRAVAQTLSYARSLSEDVRAVHVSIDNEATERIQAKWNEWNPGIPLTVVPSPYRSVFRPLMEYVDQVEQHEHDEMVTVIIPEFVPGQWWHHLLHNQSALALRAALYFRRHTVVVSVPYHLPK
jgi:amino acid transporter